MNENKADIIEMKKESKVKAWWNSEKVKKAKRTALDVCTVVTTVVVTTFLVLGVKDARSNVDVSDPVNDETEVADQSSTETVES